MHGHSYRLEVAISGHTIEGPQILAAKVHMMTDGLQELYESGRAMDELSMFTMPADLLRFVDEHPNAALEEFQQQSFDQVEAQGKVVAKRLYNLQEVKRQTVKALEEAR